MQKHISFGIMAAVLVTAVATMALYSANAAHAQGNATSAMGAAKNMTNATAGAAKNMTSGAAGAAAGAMSAAKNATGK